MNTFTCSSCHETFNKIRSDEDVQAEYEELWPQEQALGMEKAIICDPCFQEVMSWWERLSDADKLRIRKEEGIY